MSHEKQAPASTVTTIRKSVRMIPTWAKIIALVVFAQLAATTVFFSFGRPELGLLTFHAVILTILVGITCRYAWSTHRMAQATVHLAKAAREQLSFFEARRENEEEMCLQEILEELKDADSQRDPPYNVSVWKRHRGRFMTSDKLSWIDKDEIDRCYRQMQELGPRLLELKRQNEKGLPQPEGRQVLREIEKLRRQVLSDISRAMGTLKEHVKVKTSR